MRMYFVAHEYTKKNEDDLRAAIEEAFAGTDLKPYYANTEIREGHILKSKIIPKIKATAFGIYDVSNPQKPNVYLELGIALGLGKPYFIIYDRTKLKEESKPSDIRGLDSIGYDSMRDLTQQLKDKVLPQVIPPPAPTNLTVTVVRTDEATSKAAEKQPTEDQSKYLSPMKIEAERDVATQRTRILEDPLLSSEQKIELLRETSLTHNQILNLIRRRLGL